MKEYLQLSYHNQTNIEIKVLLSYVEKYNILDAVGYLKERMGDSRGALICYLQDFRNSYDHNLWNLFLNHHKELTNKTDEELLAHNFESEESLFYKAPVLMDIRSKLRVAMELCETHSKHAIQVGDENISEIEDLWFRILKVCLDLQKSIRAENESEYDNINLQYHKVSIMAKKVTNDIFLICLETMKSYVDPTRLLENLVKQSPTEENNKVKLKINIGEGIDEVLAIYRYEQLMLGTTKTLLENDIAYKISQLRHSLHQGICLHVREKSFSSFTISKSGEIQEQKYKSDPAGKRHSQNITKTKPRGVLLVSPPKIPTRKGAKNTYIQGLNAFYREQQRSRRKSKNLDLNLAPQGYDIAQDDEETQMVNRRQRSRPRDDGWRSTLAINIDKL